MSNGNMQMQAFILAGGLGTRLRPVLSDRPKSMAIIGGKPFLEHQLTFLKDHGVTQFVFCVGYRHRWIREHFRNGSKWGVKIDYSVEEQPLGTGGALKYAEKFVQDTFLALNGDSFFDTDLHRLVQFHEGRRVAAQGGKCLATMALTRVQEADRYGTVQLGSEGEIVHFAEKTAGRSERPVDAEKYINAGIYVLEPAILQMMAGSEKVSIEHNVFPSLPGGSLYGCHLEGFFVDIGTPAGYQTLQGYLGERRR